MVAMVVVVDNDEVPECRVIAMLPFTHFPNAATDAAIVLRGECRKPRVSRAIVLVLLCNLWLRGRTAYNVASLFCQKESVLNASTP